MSGFSLAALKNAVDEVRVQVYAKNDTEKKVYEALSSKNWGASSTLLNEIAAETTDYEKYQIINDIVWAAMETEGKSWKQIFKALTLVEFLIKNGSERFIETSRDKLFKIKRLQDYNYFEGTIDKGSGCREKAKQIVELLGSNETIRSEREKARALRNKFGGIGSDSRGGGFGGGGYSGSGGGNSYSDSYSNSGNQGRYGGDSYSYNDRGPSDRYSDRGGGGDRNTGRYGGGAYDSDRPPRFSDDGPSDQHDNGGGRRGSAYDSYDSRADEVDIKPAKFAPKEDRGGSTATGGKLKVSIKKAPSTSTPAPAASAAPEVNLIGDDFDPFGAAPAAPAASSAASDFDPFGSAPAAPTTAAADFDPFGSSVPAPAPAAPTNLLDAFTTPVAPQQAAPTQAAFDPFNQPSHGQPAYGSAQQQFGQQPMQQQYVQPPQQQFGQPPQQQFGQPPQQQFGQQPQQYGQFQGFTSAPPPMPTTGAPTVYQSAPPPSAAPSTDADFGDFETAKPVPAPKPAAVNKWGDLGNLVDLGGIAKNAPPPAKQDSQSSGASAAYGNNSFAGLDGFSKTPQNMAGGPGMGMGGGMGGPRQMGGGYMGAPPAGPPMMAPRPVGPPMGGPMPMGGGMGMGMPPQQAGGMGYGAPPNMMMGGYAGAPGGPAMGGYGGPPQMGYGAPPGGAPGYPPHQQQQQQYRPSGPGGW